MTNAINTATTSCGITLTGAADIDLEEVKVSKPFTQWLATVDRTRFVIESVKVQSVDKFGPRVAFVKFHAKVTDKSGRVVPGIVFARGGSVAILALLVCEGVTYVVATVQPRFPAGNAEFVEVCAGMLDGSGNFAGAAAKELKEELDIEIHEDDLTNLSELSGNPDGMFLSPGGCDETMRFFAYCKNVTRPELDSMRGKCTGALDENEQITLKIISPEDLITLPDAKSVVAYCLYQQHKPVLAARYGVVL